MSDKIPLGKVEWLKSVRVALTGLIGIGMLLTALELGAIFANPSHILMWVIPINWHFLNALQIGFLTFIAIITYYLIVLPGETGNIEAKAKLFYTNWRNTVNKIDVELLEAEIQLRKEQAIKDDQRKLEIESKMDNTVTSDSRAVSPSSTPWSDDNVSTDLQPSKKDG